MNQGTGSLSQDLIFNIPGDYDKNLLKLQTLSLFFGIIFLVVVKSPGDFIRNIYQFFNFPMLSLCRTPRTSTRTGKPVPSPGNKSRKRN